MLSDRRGAVEEAVSSHREGRSARLSVRPQIQMRPQSSDAAFVRSITKQACAKQHVSEIAQGSWGERG